MHNKATNEKSDKKMATREEREQLTAFARIDGAIVGLMWTLSFACFIGQFGAPLLGLCSMALGFASVVVATVRLRNFRDGVLGGTISFGRAFAYSMLTYFYASLIMALAQLAYFALIDDGFLFSRYTAIMNTPEYRQALELAYGMKPTDMAVVMDNLARLRPIDIALQFLSVDIILGLIISLPTAMVMKRGKGQKLKG